MQRKRFQFSLEKVLHLRRHETHVAELHLSTALRQHGEKELEFEHLRRALDEASLARPGTGRVTSARLRAAEAQCADVEKRLQRAEKQLHIMEERVKRARQKVTRFKTAQESLEVLREKQWQRFRTEEAAEETSMLDEHALTSFLRK